MQVDSGDAKAGRDSYPGKPIGTSEWFLIDQARINKFADATEDWDRLHVDPDWCREQSPFKTPISFGFLTLSLLTHLTEKILKDSGELKRDDSGYTLNYGLDRVRFVAPVPVNTRIRCQLTLLESQQRKPGQILQRFSAVVEIENQQRPALTAEWLGLHVSDIAVKSEQSNAEQEP